MLNKVLLYGLLAVLVILGSILAIQKLKIAKLEINVVELDNAVSAYEELVKVIPFNRMVEERSSNANEDINTTLNNTDVITDGIHSGM